MPKDSTLFAQTLLPVFFVLAAGYYAGWRGRIESRHPEALIVVLMQFALPCSLLLGVGNAPSAVLRRHLPLLLLLVCAMLVVYGVTFLVSCRWTGATRGEAAVQALTVAFANNVAIGLPFLTHAEGSGAQLAVIAAIVGGALVVSPLTLVLLECSQQVPADSTDSLSSRVGKALRVSLRRPVILAPALGLLLPLTGHAMPATVAASLDIAAKVTIGLALFLTGLILSAQPLVFSRNVAVGVLLKNLGQPLLVWLLLWPFHVHGAAAREAFLLACVPAGFFGTVFGARYGVPAQEAGSTLLWSTALCVLTLPLGLVLAARIS